MNDDPAILQPVLARFAAGWGADIDCAQGWWPILADLDRQIAAIAPDYRVHQIKEKFGGLRFYYALDEVGSDPRIDDLNRARRTGCRADLRVVRSARSRPRRWLDQDLVRCARRQPLTTDDGSATQDDLATGFMIVWLHSWLQ